MDTLPCVRGKLCTTYRLSTARGDDREEWGERAGGS